MTDQAKAELLRLAEKILELEKMSRDLWLTPKGMIDGKAVFNANATKNAPILA